MKKLLVAIGIIILLAFLYPMFYVPCTAPSDRAMCKKELGRLRGYLLDNDFFGISFFSRNCSSSSNEIAFCVGGFCEEVNQIVRGRMETEVFRVVPSSGGEGFLLVDHWGTPYNFCSTEERRKNRWDALLHSEVSNIVIWSSGPNKINEYGANDDVALRINPSLY